jgi:putative membrane protein
MMTMSTKERILVLSVDRDDDLGNKAKVKGPVTGKKDVVEAAARLALADPSDSDSNAMFQAVKVLEEMKKQYTAEVAVITGHQNVGIQSDREVTSQLDKVLRSFKADYVVLVTDGAEDDHVMPIIQSKVPILSVSRVVVKQAEQLESTYFKIKDFVEETLENPKFSRLIFGLPAIALILYALFGIEGWRAIVGIFGAYLLIKGFKLEDHFYNAYEELSTSFTRRRFAFFMYIIAIIFTVLATYRGYEVIADWIGIGLFETVSAYTSASIYFYFLGGACAWVGRGVNREKNRTKLIGMPVFGFAISLVIYNAAELILSPEVQVMNFIYAIIIGFALLFAALLIEWKS